MIITVSSLPSDRKNCRVNRQKPANSDDTTTDTPTESFWKGDSNGIEQQRDESKWTEKNPGQSRGDCGQEGNEPWHIASARCAVKLTSTYPAPRIGKTLEQNTSKGQGSNINDNSGAEQRQRKHAIDAATLKMAAFPFSFSSFLFLFPFLFPFFFFSFSLFPYSSWRPQIRKFYQRTRATMLRWQCV